MFALTIFSSSPSRFRYKIKVKCQINFAIHCISHYLKQISILAKTTFGFCCSKMHYVCTNYIFEFTMFWHKIYCNYRGEPSFLCNFALLLFYTYNGKNCLQFCYSKMHYVYTNYIFEVFCGFCNFGINHLTQTFVLIYVLINPCKNRI
jgi:hypothetical protein